MKCAAKTILKKRSQFKFRQPAFYVRKLSHANSEEHQDKDVINVCRRKRDCGSSKRGENLLHQADYIVSFLFFTLNRLVTNKYRDEFHITYKTVSIDFQNSEAIKRLLFYQARFTLSSSVMETAT